MFALVQYLLAHRDLDPERGTSHGHSPLYVAAGRDHLTVVELLLEDPRVKVNRVTHHGDTALSIAAQEGHHRVVEALLKVTLTF